MEDTLQSSSPSLVEAFAGVTRTFKGNVSDLYGLFERKRREEPVMQGDILADLGIPSRASSVDGTRPVWSLFRFADVQAVLRDGDTYSSALLLEHLGKFVGRLLTGLDGAEHGLVRALLQPAFSPRALQSWREEIIGPLAEKLARDIAPRGQGELFGDLLIPYPMNAIYRIIGFPDDSEEIDRFAALALSILTGMQVDADRAEEARTRAAAAAKEIIGKSMVLVAERRKRDSGGLDLISTLVRAEFDGEKLSDEDIAGFVLMLLPAAAETTTRTLSSLFALLLQNPDQMDMIRDDRSLVQRAIGEAVRYEPVPMYLARQATRDVEIGGVKIPKGAGLSLVIGSANRDESVWEDADRFDVRRKVKPSLGFGFGPHMCLGMVIARAEMEILVNAIFDHLPGLRLASGAAIPVISGAHFRGPDSLPVMWDRP